MTSIELPWTIVYGLYSFGRKMIIGQSDEERDREIMEKYDLTPEDLAELRKNQQQYYERMRNSTKYKRYKRFVKKHAK